MKKQLPFLILVTLSAFYSFYIYSSEGKGRMLGKDAMEGKRLYQQNNCSACHQIYGLGGYLGPDLTRSVRTKGKPYVQALIRSGAGRMPVYHFNEKQITELTAFLSELDQ